VQSFARMSVDGRTLASMSVDRMWRQLGMRRDAAEAVRGAVNRVASPLS